jgi:Flp pilus assembly protein TadG
MDIRTRLRREEGAAAVEFALIVGVLCMLLFGMLQFGLAFFQLQNLRAAAREGARIGAVGATDTEIRQRVQDASSGDIPANNGAIIVTTCPPKSAQTPDSVSQVRIDLNSSQLPAGLKDIFTVDIPLMPTISVKNAPVLGEFRCEGN